LYRFVGTRLVELTETVPPDVHVCRRVADYAPAPVPPQAAITLCVVCAELVAFDPNGPFPNAPRVCQRCLGIEPLPMSSE
jgi:hypothetical protein